MYLRARHKIVYAIAQLGCCDSHFAVGCTVIKIELVGFFMNNGSAGKYDVADITDTLIKCAWPKNPLIASAQDLPG